MKAKAPKGKSGGNEPTPGPAAQELPERWSVQRKAERVVRLLRGESLDGVSRESQVPAHELERWQRIFVDQGRRGLRTKTEPEGAGAHPGPGENRRADDALGAGRGSDRKKAASRTSGRGAGDDAPAESG